MKINWTGAVFLFLMPNVLIPSFHINLSLSLVNKVTCPFFALSFHNQFSLLFSTIYISLVFTPTSALSLPCCNILYHYSLASISSWSLFLIILPLLTTLFWTHLSYLNIAGLQLLTLPHFLFMIEKAIRFHWFIQSVNKHTLNGSYVSAFCKQ